MGRSRRITAVAIVWGLLAALPAMVAPSPALAAVPARVLTLETDHLPLAGDGAAIGLIVDIDGPRALTMRNTVHERDQRGIWVAVGEMQALDEVGNPLTTIDAVLSGDRAVVSARDGNHGVVIVFDLSSGKPVQLDPIIRSPEESPAVFNRFGDTIALAGNNLVINDPSTDITGADAVPVWSYHDAGAGFVNPTLVQPGTYTLDDSWGYDFAVSNDRLIVRDTSPGADAGTPNVDGVVVFDLVGDEAWTYDAVLRADLPASGPRGFLSAAGVDGDRVALGYASRGAASTAAITILEKGASTWSQVDEFAGVDFGCCNFDTVELDGDVIVVANTQELNTPRTGEFWIFERDGGGTWQEILHQDTVETDDSFAASVAVDGGRVLVGNPGLDHDGYTDNGGGMLFEDTGGGWAQVDLLVGRRAEGFMRLGEAVMVDASGIAYHSVNSGAAPVSSKGAVALVRDADGLWDVDRDQSTDPIDNGSSAFALDGNRLAVGSNVDNPSGTMGLQHGQVYIYERTSPAAPWVLDQTIEAPDTVSGNLFGDHLALDGGLLVVGASGGSNANRGGVYVFRSSGGNYIFEDKIFGGDSSADLGKHIDDLALAGGEIFVGDGSANGEFPGDNAYGVVLRFADSGGFALEQTIRGTHGQEFFGTSVDGNGTDLIVGSPRQGYVTLLRPGVGGDYEFVDEMTYPDAFDDRLGNNVDINDAGDIIASVAGRDGAAGEDVGGLHFIQIDDTTNELQITQTYEPDLPAGAQLGSTLDVDGNFVIAGAENANFAGRPSAGALQLLRLSSEPVAITDAYGVVKGGVLTVAAGEGTLANDLNPQGEVMSAELVDDVSNGVLSLTPTGAFTYTPTGNFAGFDSFSYRITTPRPTTSNTTTVAIRVSTAPVAVDDAYATTKNTTLVVSAATGLVANDTDADNDGLTLVSVATPSTGSVTKDSDGGGFTYVPQTGFTGAATFNYVVTDGVSTDTGQATITITDAPTANDDGTYTGAEDQSLVVTAGNGVLANDVSVPSGRTLIAQLVTQPGKGQVALNQNGGFTYTPGQDEFGSDSFTYRALDQGAASAPATVTLYIEAAPDPVADNYIVDEGTTVDIGPANGVLANDQGNGLTAVLVNGPGTVSITLDSDGSFEVTVPDDLQGTTGVPITDFFTYRAVENGTQSEVVRVDLTLNRAPTGGFRVYDLGNAPSISVPVEEGLAAFRVPDEDRDPVTFTKVGSEPRLTINSNGSLQYTPQPGFLGLDRFEFIISDGRLTDRGSLSFSVGKTKAVDDNYVAPEGGTLSVNAPTEDVLANDILVYPSVQVDLVSGPSGGTLVPIQAGSYRRFNYTPDAGTSTDSFVYRITDAQYTDTATVFITVNQKPVGQPDSLTVARDSVERFTYATLTANDTDPEGGEVGATLLGGITSGTLNIGSQGFTYIPVEGFVGEATFTYEPIDEEGLEGDPTTVTINVVAPVGPDGEPLPDDSLTRCAGESRIDTAVCISQRTFTDAAGGRAADGRFDAGAVVLARADNFADALAGTPFAHRQSAPLLLTATAALPAATLGEIDRVLNPGGTVWILGGTVAVSQDVEDELVAGGYDVQRLGGESRYDTAIVIADATFEEPETIFLVTARNFADAVAAGPAAIRKLGVILLSDNDTPVAETQSYLAAHPKAATYAIGGPAARAHPEADELFIGESRIDTALQVSTRFFVTEDRGGPSVVGLARADNFPDALAGGVRMGRLGGPILLVFPAALPDPVADFLTTYAADIRLVEVYGGENAINTSVADAAVAAIR